MAFIIMQNAISQTVVPQAKPLRKEFKADPQRATMLAVTFPGLGQIYNRSYWKIPLVYAGFGGIVYAAGFNGSHYSNYMKAYQDYIDGIPATTSYLDLKALTEIDPATYDPATASASTVQWYKEWMLKRVDYYRKYRDLSYIGIGLWYVFTVLDANVDASLYNYDIIDNLDLVITPNQFQTFNSTAFGINITMRYTF